jgi:DNA-binding transcriptional ArsR family regulator
MLERMNGRSDDVASEAGDLCEITLVDTAKVLRARQRVPSEGALLEQAERFKLLGEPTRLRLLHALAAEELCVCDLAALLETSPSAISHQLRLLRAARLVRFRKAGKMVYYTLDEPMVRALLKSPAVAPDGRTPAGNES